MKLTAQEEYGLRCLLQVARHAPGVGADPVSIRTVAEAEGLSVEYAAKLLRALRQVGLVDSVRGAAGGYILARPPGETTAWEVLAALDGPLYTEAFCTGHKGQLESCVHSTGCSIRVLWKWVDVALKSVLQRVTLADLLQDAPMLQGESEADNPPSDPERPAPHADAAVADRPELGENA